MATDLYSKKQMAVNQHVAMKQDAYTLVGPRALFCVIPLVEAAGPLASEPLPGGVGEFGRVIPGIACQRVDVFLYRRFGVSEDGQLQPLINPT